MKKISALALVLVTLFYCLVGCSEGDEYRHERFYGVVRFSEESDQPVVYIPKYGEVEIPESERCRAYYDGHEETDDSTYRLKPGDYIIINFSYEKSWDDNSVKIIETYPAKFDRKAYLIEAVQENTSFEKTDDGYVLSFPLTTDIESAEVGDTLYFIKHGGENGQAYEMMYASGKITAKADGIITVALTIPEGETEFLDYYNRMTVELAWKT